MTLTGQEARRNHYFSNTISMTGKNDVNTAQLMPSSMNVSEIIQKEEERHQLVRIGVIACLQDAINKLETGYPQSALNAWDKNKVLRYFYGTVAKYASFITREKATNKTLKRALFRKSSKLLQALSKSETALLDKELKTDAARSVAFHISDVIYESIYTLFCLSSQTFENPDETCSFFLQELKNNYPLYIREYISVLEQDDTSLWDITCRYLQQLSYYVTSQNSETSGVESYYTIIRDETWSKACEVLRKRIIEKEGNVPSFNTGKDFRNYMIKTCRFLALNIHKKYAKKETSLDDLYTGLQYDDEEEASAGSDHNLSYEEEASADPSFEMEASADLSFEIEASDEPEPFENNIKELDIDTGNPYEVAYAVSIILLNKGHALHQALVQGLEDKVELLINKAVHDMSYNEIVAKSYEGCTDDDEFRRAVAKARKDYERIRKTLTERLIEIVEKKGKHFVTSGNKARY